MARLREWAARDERVSVKPDGPRRPRCDADLDHRRADSLSVSGRPVACANVLSEGGMRPGLTNAATATFQTGARRTTSTGSLTTTFASELRRVWDAHQNVSRTVSPNNRFQPHPTSATSP